MFIIADNKNQLKQRNSRQVNIGAADEFLQASSSG
jgi:hypothetical protein